MCNLQLKVNRKNVTVNVLWDLTESDVSNISPSEIRGIVNISSNDAIKRDGMPLKIKCGLPGVIGEICKLLQLRGGLEGRPLSCDMRGTLGNTSESNCLMVILFFSPLLK
jgi:hypothetical protein